MASENGGARLPLELLEEIIDILAFDLFDPECRATLFECTLVCKAFYSCASGHLISDIHIGRISKTSQTIDDHVKLCKELEGLYNVLEAHPDLAPRVKALTIETCFGGVAPAKNRELLLENRHIPLIFPKLFSIVKFAWMNRAMIFPWSSFSTSVLEAFDILMDTPSLSILTFEGIEDLPADYITRCSGLKQLELTHVDYVEVVHEPSSPPTDVHAQREEIESQRALQLMINRHAPGLVLHILSGSTSASMFSRLRSLTMWMRNADEVRAAWGVMQSAAETLELLVIEDMSHFGYPTLIPGSIDLGISRKLKNITIGCRIASGDGIIVPMGISGLLSPPTSPSTIQGIEITIDWIDCRIGSEESRLTVTAEPAWDILDQTLSRLSTFPDLCRVSLNLKLGYGWSTSPGLPNPPDRIVTVKDHLERLAGRLLPLTSKLLTVKTHINVLVYKSRYALNSAYY